jgi:predicted MFS family arabinose efflux permease
MLITLTSLSGICGEFLGGIFSDNLGRLKTANLGIILMIASVFLILIKMPVALLAIVMFIWGLGWTLNHAGISTMLTDLPKEFLNEAASLNSSVRFLAGGVGVALAGLLMQKSFLLGFSVLGGGLILLLLVFQKGVRRFL